MSHGMIIVGLVAGTHLLEDIKVAIPHKVAVSITPNQMMHSKDLYRAINKGFVFKLDGGALHSTTPRVQSASVGEITKLNREVKDLQRQLREAHAKNEGLQRALIGLNTNIDGILAAIGSLKDNGGSTSVASPAFPPGMMQLLTQIVAQGGVQGVLTAASAPVSEVVGGEAPVFIADEIKPKDATTNIQVQKTASEGSDVSAATSKLKELRQEQKPG